MASTTVKVNGLAYDRSSVTINVNGKDETRVLEINYSDSLEAGKYRGTDGTIAMVTRGEYDCEADITLPREDYQAQLNSLGDDFGVKEFDIKITFNESGSQVITDVLKLTRIAGNEVGISGNSDATVVKAPLAPRWIEWGGKRLSNRK